jgi:DNA-binding NarL/FixJ family response regulator
MAPRQQGLLDYSAPAGPGVVIVDDRVSIRNEGPHRVVVVHGVVFAHYDVHDGAVEAYTMVALFQSGYADQDEIARAFGYSCRSVRRYEERLTAGRLSALGRKRGRPSEKARGHADGRDRTILRLKAQGFSNRGIARRLGLAENAIRKRLRRLGWTPPAVAALPLAGDVVERRAASASASSAVPGGCCADTARSPDDAPPDTPPLPVSLDVDPLDRSIDRLLAAMGQLDDAAPLFAAAEALPGAGVLLAVPALVASGLLSVARKVYGSIGPAFYGLRTTLVAYVLLVLLRIPRPEMLKEYAPGPLGRVIGLDRMPEVKTLRRKLTRLAAMKRGHELGRQLAELRIAARGRVVGFLYVDGHVRAYHGKRRIAKTDMTRARTAGPATTDYWVNDRQGEPLFVVTAEANAAMTRMLVPILGELRPLFSARRRLTVVFDRAGWSPKLFRQIMAMGIDILTYRKGRCRRVAERRFVRCEARIDGRRIAYLLHDQPVRLLNGTFRLRQITRLTPETGHQTAILTNRWDLRPIMVAYRMFERWRQENFFKHMRQEFLVDALTDYEVEPDNPTRLVANPARQAADHDVRTARAQLTSLLQQYGATAVDYVEGRTQTLSAFTREEQRIHREVQGATDRIATLVARRKALPTHIPLSEAPAAADAVKLSTERQHLTNVLKMVAFQAEGALVELLAPYYARNNDEGRTLIQTALRSAAAIEPTSDELRVTLAPLSSPHRSEAIRGVCQELNMTNTVFPGTKQRLTFAIAEPPVR